jgi:hypothetical protein
MWLSRTITMLRLLRPRTAQGIGYEPRKDSYPGRRRCCEGGSGALRKIPYVIAQLGRRSAQRLTAGRDWRERRGLSLDSRHLRRRQENTLSNLSCARHK